MDGFEVDCRIRDGDGYRGTVRYIGPVAAAKNQTENWLGVEWDKQDRGKHDGSCTDKEGKTHRYFNCFNGAGSFVRPSKKNPINGGRSFETALRERYVGTNAPKITKEAEGDLTLPDSFVITSKGNAKPIEFLGETKIRKWQQLSQVDAIAVRDDTISSIDDDIEDFMSHVIEIDLQDNLLYKWSDIAKITTSLPGLKNLQLHGNKFQAITPTVMESLGAATASGCFRNLTILALNACNIQSWSSFELLVPHLTALEELYLSSNSFADLPRVESDGTDDITGQTVFSGVDNAASSTTTASRMTGGFLTELRVLDMSGCNLDRWSQVSYFTSLPSLEEFLLDGNSIQEILPATPNMIAGAGGGEATSATSLDFPELNRMSISSTKIDNWTSIDSLATYPNLVNVRLSHIPLFSGKGASEVRPYVIARISSLAFFNGSTIHPRERNDAEKIYLRNCHRDRDDAAKAGHPLSEKSLFALHPRFQELQDKHGGDLTPMGSGTNGGNIASELLNVTFQNLSFSGGATNEPVLKKLPASLSVEKLKLMVQQLFNLEPHLQMLSLLVYKDAPPTVLDDDQASLSYYGTQDGAKIFINEAKDESTSK